MNWNVFIQVFVPKDTKFFPLFDRAAANLVEMSENLTKLMHAGVKDPRSKIREELTTRLNDLEHKGDEITHEIFIELSKNFITPFDREDVHGLASALDDVADYILGAATRMDLYEIRKYPEVATEIADLIQKATMEIRVALSELKNLKNRDKIQESLVRINYIENQAESLFNRAIAKLFQREKNAIELIKIKELLLTLETAADKCEDVAVIIESIMLKYS